MYAFSNQCENISILSWVTMIYSMSNMIGCLSNSSSSLSDKAIGNYVLSQIGIFCSSEMITCLRYFAHLRRSDGCIILLIWDDQMFAHLRWSDVCIILLTWNDQMSALFCSLEMTRCLHYFAHLRWSDVYIILLTWDDQMSALFCSSEMIRCLHFFCSLEMIRCLHYFAHLRWSDVCIILLS